MRLKVCPLAEKVSTNLPPTISIETSALAVVVWSLSPVRLITALYWPPNGPVIADSTPMLIVLELDLVSLIIDNES